MVTRLEAGATCDYELVPTPDRRRPVPRLTWQALGPDHLLMTLDGQPLAEWAASAGELPSFSNIHDPAGEHVVEAVRISAQLVGRAHQHTSCQPDQPLDGVTLAQLRYGGFWYDAAELPILSEQVTFTGHATPADLRLIDVTIRLTASVGPVNFDPLGRGLLHLSLPPEIRAGAVKNSLGFHGVDEVNGVAAPWVSLRWDKGSLTVFDHPANPGAPCRWRLDETLSADPFGSIRRVAMLLREPPLTLATGESLLFRYRLCLEGVETRRGATQRQFLNFVQPPRIEQVASS